MAMHTVQSLVDWQSTTVHRVQLRHQPHLKALHGQQADSQAMDSSWNQHTTSAMHEHMAQLLPIKYHHTINHRNHEQHHDQFWLHQARSQVCFLYRAYLLRNLHSCRMSQREPWGTMQVRLISHDINEGSRHTRVSAIPLQPDSPHPIHASSPLRPTHTLTNTLQLIYVIMNISRTFVVPKKAFYFRRHINFNIIISSISEKIVWSWVSY